MCGEDPLMVMGDHPALHYRGNALKRHKIWLQTDYAQGMRKYGYTGWQHAIATATFFPSAFPNIWYPAFVLLVAINFFAMISSAFPSNG